MAGPTEPAIKHREPATINNEIDIINYIQDMKSNGKAESTFTARNRSLRNLALHCNLREPEEVKAYIAETKLKKSTKHKIVNSYGDFLRYLEIKWIAPKYKPDETLPFIPLEKEIDELIATSRTQVSTLLQIIKDTGMRGSEAMLLKWTSIDYEQKTVNIIPCKGSNPRILQLNDKTIAMIKNLAKKDTEKIFNQPLSGYRTTFCKVRTKAAKKLNNPRLLQIGFHTVRHWKGTTEYHQTKDIKHVQYILGHKHSDTTDIYINLAQAQFLTSTDEWNTKISHNLDEETELINAGFQLVRSVNETTAIYKKRK